MSDIQIVLPIIVAVTALVLLVIVSSWALWRALAPIKGLPEIDEWVHSAKPPPW